MIGASGTITDTVSSTGGGATLQLIVEWRQEYTPGGKYSDLHVIAKLVQVAPEGEIAGTFFASQTGGVYVGDEQSKIITWTGMTTSAGFLYQGYVGWQDEGTVRINHRDSTDVVIGYIGCGWWNRTAAGLSVSFQDKSETVTLQAIPQPNTLTISAGSHTSVTVTKDGTALGSGAEIYAGDVLTVTGNADSGYRLVLTVNGAEFTSGGTFTVTGDVTVAATAKALGLAYIGGEKYQIYIGGELYAPYIYTADGWQLMN